ncbi:MAG: hypothetical protein QNM02_00385 [Acidimicrobiia bacterium]|nr:hypothetical protein [Acidimicrobiia bacterium]
MKPRCDYGGLLRRTAIITGSIAAGLLAVACSVQETIPAPGCVDGASGLIMAQSVPTASQLPCFTQLPDGWKVVTVNVNQDRTVVTLDSDRAGDGAAVLRFEERCDVGEAVPAPGHLGSAQRYDLVVSAAPSFEGRRYYVFPGGCVWWAFDFDSGTSATEAVALAEALVLISREDLNASVRESFIDEEI